MPATASCSTTRAPRRGETFVTRKITAGPGRVFAQGLEDCLYMGNIDALRDWGHARDYVRMQWMMLQQDTPEDFVIATGKQYSVREFIPVERAEARGFRWNFRAQGVERGGGCRRRRRRPRPGGGKPGDVVLRIDPRYFRPAEGGAPCWAIRRKARSGWAGCPRSPRRKCAPRWSPKT
ncbi:MAG: GDP-mannose 4,6-dehydratase, partial [Roseovarius sp.]|nr:GDP-mannose 4,6-dehydratase [Roseovarius sp.]